MKKIAHAILGLTLATAVSGPALAADDRWQDRHHDQRERWRNRHQNQHERLEERHDRTHERLEERHERAHERGLTRREHNRLHNRLEDKHERADRRLEQRHDAQHGRSYGYGRRYDGRGYGWGYDPRYDGRGYGWGYDPRYDGRGYRGYTLRGEGWSRLGWIVRDTQLASWVLANFDYNRNGSLGAREADDARRAIYRMADRNRDGRLSNHEFAYWRSYATRY